MVGDIYGKPGVQIVERLLPGLLRVYGVDFCIINGENADNGKGITQPTFRILTDAGADVITGGNHTLYRDKSHSFFDEERRLLRPLNFPDGSPGVGSGVFDAGPGRRVGVLNLVGRAMLPAVDDPFRLGSAEIDRLRKETSIVLVDFHAAATAEKIAFLRYVDGRVSAVVGTHTHVQTADEHVTEGGCAYITDVGMTGSHAGVIGMHTDSALQRFLYPMGGGKSAGATGDERLTGVVIDVDPEVGRALAIHRLQVS